MKHSFPETSGGWKKYEGNPVLGGPEMGTCFDIFVLNLVVPFQLICTLNQIVVLVHLFFKLCQPIFKQIPCVFVLIVIAYSANHYRRKGGYNRRQNRRPIHHTPPLISNNANACVTLAACAVFISTAATCSICRTAAGGFVFCATDTATARTACRRFGSG